MNSTERNGAALRAGQKGSLTLSVVIPAFNEARTLETLVQRVVDADIETTKDIVVVDDASTDGTTEIIRRLEEAGQVRACYHRVNQGKGACLRTGFHAAEGDMVLVQDADLEYDPADIPRLLQPILDGRADVVFGSRFHGEAQRVHLFWHRVANGMLTLLSNMLNNLNLSDMESGYKLFRKEVVESLEIRESRFGVEPEITAKIAKSKYRIYEVPISYAGRDYAEGKKIGVRDAVRALWCIVRYRI